MESCGSTVGEYPGTVSGRTSTTFATNVLTIHLKTFVFKADFTIF